MVSQGEDNSSGDRHDVAEPRETVTETVTAREVRKGVDSKKERQEAIGVEGRE